MIGKESVEVWGRERMDLSAVRKITGSLMIGHP
jgi:hypothetical protein